MQAAQFKAESTTKSRLLLSRMHDRRQARPRARSSFRDSITDGYCSTVDTNNRWPDHIAERLQAEDQGDVAVVNEAYSGDRVLANGMGQNALSRFDTSVLSHPRVSTVVMMMGINDIGWPGKTRSRPPIRSRRRAISPPLPANHRPRSRARHPLRCGDADPVRGHVQGHAAVRLLHAGKGAIREDVNKWIRENKSADGLIDFDKVVEDPANPGHINPVLDCGDHLHPNDAGYQAMAKAVDLGVLLGMHRVEHRAAHTAARRRCADHRVAPPARFAAGLLRRARISPLRAGGVARAIRRRLVLLVWSSSSPPPRPATAPIPCTEPGIPHEGADDGAARRPDPGSGHGPLLRRRQARAARDRQRRHDHDCDELPHDECCLRPLPAAGAGQGYFCARKRNMPSSRRFIQPRRLGIRPGDELPEFVAAVGRRAREADSFWPCRRLCAISTITAPSA